MDKRDQAIQRFMQEAEKFAKPVHDDTEVKVKVDEPKTVADKLNYLGDLLLDESISQFERAIEDDTIPMQAATLSQARQILERVGILDNWKAAIEKQGASGSSQMPKRLLELVQG